MNKCARLPPACVPACHSTSAYMRFTYSSPAWWAAQDKLITAESKVAELTKQLEELRFQKASIHHTFCRLFV